MVNDKALDVDALAQAIRRVDGSNSLGAGALAEALMPYLNAAKEGGEPVRRARFAIEHDGFVGTVIGDYVRLDGKRGVVMQQDGTKVVHVYGEKWLCTAPPVSRGDEE